MNNLDTQAFTALFRDAYQKCFGSPLVEMMSETESKLFYTKIFDQTGLVIGWKSLKNYSSFVISGGTGKSENPSIATLDSLARYVSDAPYMTETERKDKEAHFPYWFSHKEQFHRSMHPVHTVSRSGFSNYMLWVIGFFILVTAFMFIRHYYGRSSKPFTDDFQDLSEAGLSRNGWFVQSRDSIFWNRRMEIPNQLTLFTLRGDNWPDKNEKIRVPNLMLRKITEDCFEAELYMADFLPVQNWQQAGLLLLEDTNFTGKSVRLSLSFNDFFGGYHKPAEILIQAITSSGKNYSDPEEIAHQPIVNTDSLRLYPELKQNLATSSLKIEKDGRKFRFLYAGGSVTNPAFREITTHEFDIHPRYIGIFAMRGFVDSARNIPVHFTFFRFKENACK